MSLVGGAAVAVAALSQFVPASAVSSGSFYDAINTTRVMDTRTTGTTLGPGGTTTLCLLTACGAPSNLIGHLFATAVSLNVTVTNTTAASFLTAYPAGTTRPTVSNLNWVAGQTVANAVVVPIGTSGTNDGAITFYNNQGKADVVVDLNAEFTTHTAAAYVPVSPTRIADTRVASGYPNAGQTMTAGETENFLVQGEGPVPTTPEVRGVVLNVTVTDTTAASFLTVWNNGDESMPVASTLNWAA
ncbi:MAG TPA: hypothetical protein VEK76_02660, partial [Candidatus Binatia bacterium]|nr:hypothetical protein [Candidatus Binatia bacterium]